MIFFLCCVFLIQEKAFSTGSPSLCNAAVGSQWRLARPLVVPLLACCLKLLLADLANMDQVLGPASLVSCEAKLPHQDFLIPTLSRPKSFLLNGKTLEKSLTLKSSPTSRPRS
jgi:hypothetical protein